jgi:hypothetical protein
MNIRAQIYGGVQPAEEPLLPTKRPKGAKAAELDSIKVPRESRQRSNSRGEDRHRLSGESARVRYDGRNYDVELINLSGGGAMIAGRLRPLMWDHVNLHLGTHGDIECAVRWLREGRIGLEFAHETQLGWPSDQVATVLRHVIERTFPHIDFAAVENKPAPPLKEAKMEPADDGRCAPRHPLIWNGVLHHDYQSSNVRIRNISETGAMIETDEKVRVGTEPLLELTEAVSLSATVEWAVGDQVGLRFHSPFDMQALAEARPSVAPVSWTPPAYLDPDANSDADHWGRLSISQLHQELEGFLKR